jgi:hypothetical protein
LTEHLTQKQVEDYCRQRLVVAELLPVSAHLNDCEICRQQIETSMNPDSAFLALRDEVIGDLAESSHLSAEQTGLYVDKQLMGDELQTVTDHLSGCEQCAYAVADLQAFSREVAPSLDVEYRPLVSARESKGWWQRTLSSFSRMFTLQPVPAFGAALAILLLAVVGWFVWKNTRQKEPAPQIAVTPASPQPAPSSELQPAPAPVQPESVPVVAQLKDGNAELTLDRDGKLSGANDLPASYQNLIKRAMTSKQVERSAQLEGLSRPPSSLMGANDGEREFSVVGPAGTVSLTDRPTFTWGALAGATGYVVEVYDSNFKLVVVSDQLTKTSWSAPQPLPRGTVYSWQVKAKKDGEEITSPRPPAPQAKFRILDQAKANEIARAKRAYGSSHLVLGMMYADAGLLRDAEQEFRLLLKANPDSEIARTLLRQIQALRR